MLVSNEKTSIWAKEDSACALENMFLAAHSLGIGSVWINQLKDICDDVEIRQYLNEIGVPTEHNVYGVAALGYAEKEPSQDVVKKGIVKIIE